MIPRPDASFAFLQRTLREFYQHAKANLVAQQKYHIQHYDRSHVDPRYSVELHLSCSQFIYWHGTPLPCFGLTSCSCEIS